MEGDCAQIEAELRGLSEKLVNTVNDRIAIEESLRAARAQVTYLQNELVALMNVRDTLKGQVGLTAFINCNNLQLQMAFFRLLWYY